MSLLMVPCVEYQEGGARVDGQLDHDEEMCVGCARRWMQNSKLPPQESYWLYNGSR